MSKVRKTDRKYLYIKAQEATYILKLGHAIPVCHGWARQYVEENYPGWSWNYLSGAIRRGCEFVHVGVVENLCVGVLIGNDGSVLLDTGDLEHSAKNAWHAPKSVQFC